MEFESYTYSFECGKSQDNASIIPLLRHFHFYINVAVVFETDYGTQIWKFSGCKLRLVLKV